MDLAKQQAACYGQQFSDLLYKVPAKKTAAAVLKKTTAANPIVNVLFRIHIVPPNNCIPLLFAQIF